MIPEHKESTPDSPLNTLAAQFTQWRATRESRRSPVPTPLRQQALALLKDYRKSHVIKALGINNNMLKNWQGPDAAEPTSNPFIPLHSETAVTTSTLAFTLTYSQGATLQVTGNFSLAQLTAFTQGLCPAQKQEGLPL